LEQVIDTTLVVNLIGLFKVGFHAFSRPDGSFQVVFIGPGGEQDVLKVGLLSSGQAFGLGSFFKDTQVRQALVGVGFDVVACRWQPDVQPLTDGRYSKLLVEELNGS
jgi:hypothetical protein